MKKITSFFFAGLIALSAAYSYTAIAKGPSPKVEICHLTGNGSYILINVSSNALDAHEAHGDMAPFETPFGSSCDVPPPPPPLPID